MPSKRISTKQNSGMYFLTLTVLNWEYVFNRYNRWKLLSNSLEYCVRNKDLQIYSFVFMFNHLHLIIDSPDVSGFVRDFKRFNAKVMKESIKTNEPDLLKRFVNCNGCFHFWEKTNMPLYIETEELYVQKKTYIEENPVRKGYVSQPELWYWSSANDGCSLKCEDDIGSGYEP